MNIRCTNCKAAFSVDDAKVKNRRFAFKCPKCNAENVFDNRPVEPDVFPEDAIGDFQAFEKESPAPHSSNEAPDTSAMSHTLDGGLALDDNALGGGLEDFPIFDDDVLSFDEHASESSQPKVSEPNKENKNITSAEDNGLSSEELTDFFPLDTAAETGEAGLSAFGAPKADEEEDESITIDLDDLDIDIADTEENRKADFEDESITLDLDALDIPVEEPQTFAPGIFPDEDEKFTLDDAGLTIDDLAEDKAAALIDTDLDYLGNEHFVGTNLNQTLTDDIGLDDELKEAESILSDWQYEGEPWDTESLKADEEVMPSNDYLQSGGNSDNEIYEASSVVSYMADYAIKYSRLKAVFRLIGLVFLSKIPHILVTIIYFILSFIVGLMNQILVLIGGKPSEDFGNVIINTVRNIVFLDGYLLGVTDESPNYSGRTDMLYSQQMDVVSPSSYSPVLAWLRLSIVGIVVLLLPHFICFIGMLCFLPFVYLFGTLAVLFTGKLPYVLFKLLVRYHGYLARVWAFAFGAVDKYPPFRL